MLHLLVWSLILAACFLIFCKMVLDFTFVFHALLVLVALAVQRLLRRLWGWIEHEVWLLFEAEREAIRERFKFALR